MSDGAASEAAPFACPSRVVRASALESEAGILPIDAVPHCASSPQQLKSGGVAELLVCQGV
jgi:hypothetical protein